MFVIPKETNYLLKSQNVCTKSIPGNYFSVCDLASGFHQIKMDPADSHKRAFMTPFGHYEFDRMLFD